MSEYIYMYQFVNHIISYKLHPSKPVSLHTAKSYSVGRCRVRRRCSGSSRSAAPEEATAAAASLGEAHRAATE